MKSNVIDINGNVSSGGIELNDSVFGVDVNDHLIWEAVKNELANKRQGTHSTKTRHFVSGGGKKPYRQKGTGRARQGTSRSPVNVGGGVAFGPHPRDYSSKMPRKAKRNAYKSIFSKKIKAGALTVVDEFKIDSGKTKDAFNALSNIVSDKRRVVLVYKEEDQMMKRAMRNLSWAKCLSYQRLSAHELFYAKHVLITKEAALELNSFLLKGSKEGAE